MLCSYLALFLSPIPAHDAHQPRAAMLDFGAADALLDADRGHLYLTNREGHELVRVDPDSGAILRRWPMGHLAEALAMTPDGSRLYVALPDREHSSFWFDGHYGWIAEIDLETGEHTRTLEINEDPYDIVAIDAGFLVVASGSGQWDEIRSYDLETGANVGTASIRQRSRLALHPGQTRVYAANTDLSPSDIERFDIDPATGALTDRGDSIYHGDHPMGGNVHVHPAGALLVTRGGGVYTSDPDREQDMLFVRTLDFGLVQAVAFDEAHAGLLTAGASTIDYYNLASLESVERLPVADVDHLFVVGETMYAVSAGGGSTTLTAMPNPAAASVGNTPPVAAFDIGQDPIVAGQTIKFDVSGTQDAQQRAEELVYRWDFDGDEVFDTPFTSGLLTERPFAVAGTKWVTMEVKDRFGLVDRVRHAIDVRRPRHISMPFEPQLAFELPFEAADVLFHPGRPFLYATSLDRRRLVQVYRWSGLVTREWSFERSPESLTLSADGDRLYVALLLKPHSAFQFDDQAGEIAEIDLDSGAVLRIFPINEDPYDMVATGTQHLVVSSGSGQWDDLRSYDLMTEANVGTTLIRHRSRLTLHPSQTRVYAANTDVSPSDIERFDLDPATGALTRRWDSPYHGQHPMSGNVYAHPGGDFLITRGGGVYTSAELQAADMQHVMNLPGGAECLAFSADGTRFVRAHLSNPILYVHGADFQPLADFTLNDSGPVRFVEMNYSRILAATRSAGVTRFHEIRLASGRP